MEVPSLVDDIMANDCSWKMKSQFSLRVWYMVGGPCFHGRPQSPEYTNETS